MGFPNCAQDNTTARTTSTSTPSPPGSESFYNLYLIMDYLLYKLIQKEVRLGFFSALSARWT
jgi:hypothetical protein